MNVMLLHSNHWHVLAIHVAIFTQLVELYVILLITKYYCSYWGTRWRTWLRHCATSQKVTGSIPNGVIGFFH